MQLIVCCGLVVHTDVLFHLFANLFSNEKQTGTDLIPHPLCIQIFKCRPLLVPDNSCSEKMSDNHPSMSFDVLRPQLC